MATNVGQLSTDELKEIIGTVVEEKLKEILGDPDDRFEIHADVRERLSQQKKLVSKGERGEELQDVVNRLGVA
jgi:CO dehydrogenase/acetyl-CoA synthase alpha subunit